MLQTESPARPGSHSILVRSLTAYVLAILTYFIAAFPIVASAQTDFRYAYPDQLTVSPTGVNLQTGRLAYFKTDLTIGPLSLVRAWGDSSSFPGPGFGAYTKTRTYVVGWTHSMNQGVVTVYAGNDRFREVVVDRKRYSFIMSGETPTPWNAAAQGANLLITSGGYSLTDQDGATYTFTTKTAVAAVLDKAEYANGVIVSYAYVSDKLRTIKASNGYAMVIEYNAAGNVAAACGFNTAFTYVDSDTTCATSMLKATYGYASGGGSLVQVTDVRGNVVQLLGYANMGGPLCITLPNSTNCELQNAYGRQPSDPSMLGVPTDVVRVQTTASGEVWKFDYDLGENVQDVPIVAGQPRWTVTTMTDPGNKKTVAYYDRGRLVDLYQPSGLTNYRYRAFVTSTPYITWDFHDVRPSIIERPEGNREYYLFNNRGSVMLHSYWPKGAAAPTSPTSANPDIARCCVVRGTQSSRPGERAFGQAFLADSGGGFAATGCGSGATDAKLCNKPLATIDARSFQTDYTYDPAHGGVLTETGPAVGGIRPQIRYTYVQRSAWIKDAAGGYVQAATPVWLLASRSSCKTSSATGNPLSPCAAGASDEVRTIYEYGPEAGPNNLLLAGTVEDATGMPRRTCFGYDWLGNRIRETKPKGTASLSVCS